MTNNCNVCGQELVLYLNKPICVFCEQADAFYRLEKGECTCGMIIAKIPKRYWDNILPGPYTDLWKAWLLCKSCRKHNDFYNEPIYKSLAHYWACEIVMDANFVQKLHNWNIPVKFINYCIKLAEEWNK